MIDLELSKVTIQNFEDNRDVMTITPLPTGYGMTMGNALRRILLSSLPGAAITAIKVEGVSHEFETIPGIKESVIDIILNLKNVRIRKYTPDPVYITLKATKEGLVTAGNFDTTSDVEVINTDQPIATLAKKMKFEMKAKVESGTGYLPTMAREKKEQEAEMINIDALFSPIKKVRYEVSNTRVGKMTNLDKLDLEIETDGTVSPQDVLSYSARLLSDYALLMDFSAPKVTEEKEEEKPAETEEEDEEKRYTPVETLKLTPRTLNALINNKIFSVEHLIEFNEKQLSNMKGLGKKAIDDISNALEPIGKKLAES